MLMKRRGVHAGLVVKVSLFSNVNRRSFNTSIFACEENLLLLEPIIKIITCQLSDLNKQL